jgi:hypothetical protein
MTFKGDPVHEAADKVAELTGVPRFGRWLKANHSPYQTRRQIILPAIAIVGSVTAFIATLFEVRSIGALAPLFFYLAYWARPFGPIRLRDAAMPYDEREQVLIWRSRSIGMATALGLALVGCAVTGFYDGFSALENIDVNVSLLRRSIIELTAVCLLATTAIGVTTISASLLLPKRVSDDEDA